MSVLRRVLIIQGHPDPQDRHLNHVLADAYAEGAVEAGHEIRRLSIAELEFPLLRSQKEWQDPLALPPSLKQAQDDIAWCEHLVLFFPLWLGEMPALVKGFLEQVMRPGFAVEADGASAFGRKALQGRSARLVVTMGMPSLVYRWYFRAHSLKSLERNVLGFVGFAPIEETLVGGVDQIKADGLARWQAKMRRLGRIEGI
ncbi:MAG TPA: NAD(P)H-dependent oxidoreductase [Hydrogenophaga sp.]|uniref:NAD(P)H-dependent oxidoreductase n=1 Tax=Hydrogenophaga sp. TaxID=1904254 RepID=UPI002CF90E2A|nr:NAD(P)H-dependent oxidoreductase [Hydrogenophaga sp.]HMN93801.1 NAD(P)H-dependent oxidoreductase [Hydrogenophaga sp.]HMP09676.1 NAD(P)H-dependent oxidoreductase [Hydrogenophaga sp.]